MKGSTTRRPKYPPSPFTVVVFRVSPNSNAGRPGGVMRRIPVTSPGASAGEEIVQKPSLGDVAVSVSDSNSTPPVRMNRIVVPGTEFPLYRSTMCPTYETWLPTRQEGVPAHG